MEGSKIDGKGNIFSFNFATKLKRDKFSQKNSVDCIVARFFWGDYI